MSEERPVTAPSRAILASVEKGIEEDDGDALEINFEGTDEPL